MPQISPSVLQFVGDIINYCFDTTTYNHSYRRAGKPKKQFMEFLRTPFLYYCLNPKNEPQDYTFKRISTFDYMLAVGHDIGSAMNTATNSFVRSDWTEHTLLTKTCTTGMTNCGKGIWRANPHLAIKERTIQAETSFR